VVEVEKKGNKYRMKVTDTGPGMIKDEVDNLFQSFTRGITGQRVWTGGSGLGLYIAKKFVDMHNGKIWAESGGQGKGSTFYVELPIKE
jgi:signal transduction histidine kinase